MQNNRIQLNPFTLAGQYKLVAAKANGNQRELTGWFDNLITDAGLDEIAVTKTWLDCCQVGNGIAGVPTPPAVSDTTLNGFVAGTNNRIYANSSATSGEHTVVPVKLFMNSLLGLLLGIYPKLVLGVQLSMELLYLVDRTLKT